MSKITSKIKEIIILFLRKQRFIHISQYDIMKNNMKKKYFLLLKNIPEQNPEKIVSIVFSKDRAMQLHAFLRSYMEKIRNGSPMMVLYKTSDIGHEQSYNDLIEIFKDVIFVEEYDFKKQLIELIKTATAGKIIFFVDDMIITHDFDFNILRKIDTNEYIVSLTRGQDLTYSTVLQKNLTLPQFHYENNMLCFRWDELKNLSDWTYPLGVSGYMYGKTEMLSMLESLNFKAPNSLEGSMQEYWDLFIGRFGLCTREAIATCVHANIVQTEGFNPILNTFSTKELLQLWNENKQIDLSPFYYQPVSTAQVMMFSFQNKAK